MKIKTTVFISVLFLVGLTACEELQDPPIHKEHASLFVKLMVTPGDNSDDKSDPTVKTVKLDDDVDGTIEEVNIDLMVVGAIINDTLHSLYTNAGIYNLLDYTEMKDTILASKSVPIGYLSQIRLVLGKNNSIKIDGKYVDLKAPSASESGLKFNVQQEIMYGVIYTYLLDFDVEKSIVQNDNKFLLKPVIKVSTISTADTAKVGG